jgi:hypothetical protein
MMQPLADKTHEMFWQQLLRWLVADAPGRVMASTPRPILSDESRVPLRVEVRDKSFRPVANATVEAHIVGPGGIADNISLAPMPLEQGVYTAEWSAAKPGSYMVEVVVRQGKQEAGRDVLVFRREDGVAENFPAKSRAAGKTGGTDRRPLLPANRTSRLVEDIRSSKPAYHARNQDFGTCPWCFWPPCCCARRSGCCAGSGGRCEADGTHLRVSSSVLLCRDTFRSAGARGDLLPYGRRNGRRTGLRAALRFVGWRD